VREYVWMDGRPVAQEEHPNTNAQYFTYAVHVDHIGLPRALTNSSGQTVWKATGRPFGDIDETTLTDSVSGRTVVTNLRLPGQYDERLLASVGLQGPYYNWNRWYLPSVGRYLELDPIAKAGGFNGFYGPNWYGYAEGNPLTYIDPLGLWYLDINVSGGFGLGVTVGIILDSKESGFHVYGGGGLTFPGIGGSITWSPSDVSPGWNVGLQGQGGPAVQVGYAKDDGWFWEAGVGWLPGASLMGYYVSPELMKAPPEPCGAKEKP
jgi:RHS repeat-associated protein